MQDRTDEFRGRSATVIDAWSTWRSTMLAGDSRATIWIGDDFSVVFRPGGAVPDWDGARAKLYQAMCTFIGDAGTGGTAMSMIRAAQAVFVKHVTEVRDRKADEVKRKAREQLAATLEHMARAGFNVPGAENGESHIVVRAGADALHQNDEWVPWAHVIVEATFDVGECIEGAADRVSVLCLLRAFRVSLEDTIEEVTAAIAEVDDAIDRLRNPEASRRDILKALEEG